MRLLFRLSAVSSASLWLIVTAATVAEEPGLLPSGGEETEQLTTWREGLALQPARENKAQALAHYFSGLAAVRRQDPARAIEKFHKVLERDPSNLRLALGVAEFYAQAQKTSDGIAVLEQSLARNPDQPSAYINLSEFCSRHHHGREEIKQRGEAVAREAVTQFPSEAATHANLAYWLMQEGSLDAAATVLREAAARAETAPRYWLDLANAARRVWSARTAEGRAPLVDLYEKALSLAPNDPAVLENVADFHALNGALNEAAELYARLVQQRPDQLIAREKLARALAVAGRPEEAVTVWRALLDIDPQNGKAHEALARHAAHQGELETSVHHRAEALRWNSEAGAWREGVALARDMLSLGLDREALAVLERASFHAPDALEPPVLSALAHAKLKEFSRAAAAFARAEEIALAAPTNEAATALLNDEFYYEWAMVCEAASLLDDAESKLRRAIEVTPPDEPHKAAKSYNALAYLWLEHDRRIEEAGPFVERALRFEPENAAYLDTLGWFHFKKGEFAQAVAVLTRAHRAAPEPVAEILDHLAQAQWQAGSHADALATLKEAAALPEATEDMRRRLEQWRNAPPSATR